MLVVLYTFAPDQLDPIPLTKKKSSSLFCCDLYDYFISFGYKCGHCICRLGLTYKISLTGGLNNGSLFPHNSEA